MTAQTITSARTSAVDTLLGRRYTDDTNFFGNVERRKMVARSMIPWYADVCCNRFGLAESVPAAKQPEQCDEPRGLMWPLGDGSSLVRPGLSPTFVLSKMISTTTDDGTPIRCEICGESSLVNVSRPPGDSVCPNCGTFLWVDALVEITQKNSFVPDIRLREIVATVRSEAVREITRRAAAEFDWSIAQQNELNAAILKREELGSTGIGQRIRCATRIG